MANPFERAEFRWNETNRARIAKHNVSEWEAEHVVRHPAPQYPRRMGNRYLVLGRLPSGQWLEVVLIKDPPPRRSLYIIHAIPK
jgi:hypothetical protein